MQRSSMVKIYVLKRPLQTDICIQARVLPGHPLQVFNHCIRTRECSLDDNLQKIISIAGGIFGSALRPCMHICLI